MKEYDGLLYSEDYKILHGQVKGTLQNEYKLHEETRRINDGAFWNSKIENILFNENLEYIGHHAFQSSNLKNVIIILNSVKLNVSAFTNIWSLDKVYINTEEIPERCFANSTINDLNLPFVKTLREEAFKDAIIMNKTSSFLMAVETIGKSAFARATFNFDTFIIPDSVTEIDNYAFKGTNLKEICLHENIEYLSKNFADKGLTIYAPTGLIKKFPFLKEYPFLKITGDNVLEFLLESKTNFKEINKIYKNAER